MKIKQSVIDEVTRSLPSVPQMVNRSNSGHYKALLAIRDNTTAVGPDEPLSAVRGMRTCLSTLRAWGCIEGDTLTLRGQRLLEAIESRRANNPLTRYGF